MVKVQTRQNEPVGQNKVAKNGRIATKLLIPSIKSFSKLILYLVIVVGIFLTQINLPDIPSTWKLYWFVMLFLCVFAIILLLFWIQQGYIKIYWGHFALVFLSVIGTLWIKYMLDKVGLTHNLFDLLAISPLPLNMVLWASILALLVLILFLNYFKGSFEKLVQYFHAVVMGLIILSIIVVSYAVHFDKVVLINGGINYFFKGILMSINRNAMLDTFLTLGLGGAAISTVIYLSFAVYWFIKARASENAKVKAFSIFMFFFWFIASFLTGLMSLNVFVMWLVLVILIGGLYIAKATKVGKFAATTQLIIISLFTILIISLGGGVFILIKTPTYGMWKNYISFQLANFGAIVLWIKNLKLLSTITAALNYYSYLPKLILIGGPFGTGAQLIQSFQLFGKFMRITPYLIYLLEFGVLAVIAFILLILVFIRFIKLLDENTFILLTLLPIVVYPLFFIPTMLGWVLFFSAVGFILAIIFNAEIVTLGLYKLGSGNRKATSLIWLITIIGIIGSVLALGNLYFIYKDYHVLIHAQNRVINSMSDITKDYIKLASSKSNKKESEKEGIDQVLNDLNQHKINQLRVEIQQFLVRAQSLEHRTSNAQLIDLSRFYVNQELAAVAMAYPKLYSYVLGAPNSDGINNYIASIYRLQQDVQLPIVYKELAKAWLVLNRFQKNPVYISRATIDYDRFLWFNPLDYEVLDSYINLLLQQYKGLLSSRLTPRSKDVTQSLRAINLRIQVLLQNFAISANNLYMQTGNLLPLLKLTSYRAQYYILNGNRAQAQKVFENLRKFVESTKLNKQQKQRLLRLIQQIQANLLNNNSKNVESKAVSGHAPTTKPRK